MNIVFGILILLFVNSCGENNSSSETEVDQNSSSEIEVDQNSSNESQIIMHDGIEYRIVTSPFTGRKWLDRNLGAARVCQSFNDTACYGDYYQWGRGFDGHQDATSNTTNKQAISITNAGSDFILGEYIYRNDWANESDKNGDKRMERISSYDGSFVCPEGFGIPSVGEFLLETSQASTPVSNNIEAYENFLKLPSSGLRRVDTGNLRIDDTNAFYHVKGGDYDYSVDYFYYSADSIGKGGLSDRANGKTIRCVKY